MIQRPKGIVIARLLHSYKGSVPMQSAVNVRRVLGLGATERIRIDRLVEMFGIELRVDPNLEGSGLVQLADDCLRITFRPGASRGWDRLTIAHEIGHIVEGHVLEAERLFLDGPPSDDPLDQERELQANAFAHELLMPTAGVIELALSGVQTLEQHANHFDVPEEVMRSAMQTIIRAIRQSSRR